MTSGAVDFMYNMDVGRFGHSDSHARIEHGESTDVQNSRFTHQWTSQWPMIIEPYFQCFQYIASNYCIRIRYDSF